MRKKLFRNVFFTLLAFCFMGTGIFGLTMKTRDGSAFAENTSSTEISNSGIPEYFSAEQFTDSQPSTSSLISSNIFMYQPGESLKLSLKTNGSFNTSVSEIYNYVYYPQTTQLSNFNFYRINNVGLKVNGVNQDITLGNYVVDSGLSFSNSGSGVDTITLQTFEINFNSSTPSEENRSFKVTNNVGDVVEGIYTLSLNIVLFSCNDGKSDASEESFSDTAATINYSFYVVAKNHYLENDAPKITRENFDKEVQTSTSLVYDYYLYSNYSSEGAVSNTIPYISFDYERYEIQIAKEHMNKSYSEALLYDLDNQTLVSSGDEIVHFNVDETSHTAKVFFYDVGNYSITYNNILILNNKKELTTTLEKHNLTGITQNTKKTLVYVYGYQANYTDMDKPMGEGNLRQVSEMKIYDFENEVFAQSADLTSGFLNSSNSYSQQTAETSGAFLIQNVANYITNNNITPVKTNQTPIKFTQNANLSSNYSYIFTTKQLSSNYQSTGVQLGEDELYKTRFFGQAEGATGKYIYIISYTFNNYYSSASTLAANKIFYQVFYFEINKDLPSITVKTADGNEIDEYVNQDVEIYDTTKQTPYNKDVEIRIYAQNFNGALLSKYGGSSGISYNSLLENAGDNHITLSDDAHYFVRLYFKNEITPTNILFTSKTGAFREQYFTIDKTKIQNIKASNVAEILNSTNYRVVSTMPTNKFITNQNIVVSWDNKASGAATYAYYRYFKIDPIQYYSSSENHTSALLEKMLLTFGMNNSYLPVNYALDMGTSANNIWTDYKGNALEGVEAGVVSSEYVFSDEGLYLVDVYDRAGNHSVSVFMIDYTTPIFSLYDTDADLYTITNGSTYISTESYLYWAKYKSLYIKNLAQQTLYTSDTPESDRAALQAKFETSELYKDHTGTFNNAYDIYCAIYTTLRESGYMQYLTCEVPIGPDVSVSTYTNLYVTVPLESIYYYLNDKNVFEQKSGRYYEQILADKEMTYQVLIRDKANTKYVAGSPETSQIQYTQYYSASQKISVSFDSSKFVVSYSYTEGGRIVEEELSSNNFVVSKVSDDPADNRKSKTTYLNPTRMEKPFYLSFTPTQIEGDSTIQVESVIIKYYPFTIQSITENGITYFYYALSTNATQIPVYEYDSTNPSTENRKEPIRLNYDNVTMPGKYEITRVYKLGEGFSYNENDFYSRTFVFYVDRNDVITNPELVPPDSGDHLESLVGGDVFVAMYDNMDSTDLVVTFPNSYEGNSEGSSLYNTGVPRTILTTNMFPVRVYVPRFKYTKNVSKVESGNHYYFTVTNNDEMNIVYSLDENDYIMPEYALYAEIYKNGTNEANLVARSSTSNNVTINTISYNEYGFLKFINTSGTELQYISQPGTYYVKIYQGWLGTEIGVNKYLQSITFCFEVQNPAPDFTASTVSHESLNSTAGSGSVKEIYYTNQSTIELSWNAGSDYITEIDVDKITFKVGGSALPTTDIWVQEPTLSNNTYISQISLSKLGVYTNDGYVDITMQYKNHDARFYQTVTKRIYIDLSAPYTNIDNLVEQSLAGNYVPSLKSTSLRTCYTANMEETTNKAKTSYNTSNSNNSGNFAYYSYMVTPNFLSTLRGNKTYLTYIRAFGENDGTSAKYSQEEMQETLPLEFLPSNFKEVADTRLVLEADHYYEVVEMDMAKNMTIYTIYVVSYDSKQGEANNLITYLDGNGDEQTYTIDDYKETKSYTGAIHNIYSRIGFQLENLNYFGDVWAQFKLVSTSATGASTTSYFMLTPWDKTHAYSFSGSSVRAVEISELINGALNSRYKSSITFFNRQNGTTESFYINTRNTDLYATLTDTQTREYIKFTAPTDAAINNTTTAATYLTGLKIYANNELLFEQTQRLGFSSLWISPDEKILITKNAAQGTILFEINPALGFSSNTKILYEYTNNYGQNYTEIHFYKETIISKEISSENDLYAYYTPNGTLFYITKDGFQYTYNPAKYNLLVYDYVGGNKSEEETTKAELVRTINPNGTTTLTLHSAEEAPYDDMFVIDIKNDDRLVKSIYLRLYDYLPEKNLSQTAANLPGQYKLLDASRNNITQNITESLSNEEAGYFSEVTLMYALADSFIPVRYSISTDKVHWTEVDSGTIFKNDSDTMAIYYLKVWYDERYIANEFGSAEYLFEYVPAEQIYSFNLSSLTSTFWVEKTIGGVTTIVEKGSTIFKTAAGAQYSNHYLVNLGYSDREAIQIKTNKEQDIEATLVDIYNKNGESVDEIPAGETVASQLWKISNENSTTPNIPSFSTFIVISYVKTSENFVDKFYSYNTNGVIDTSTNLISSTSKSFVVSQDYTTITKIELQWSKYYGIVQNEINISLTKDGISIAPTVFTREVNNEMFNYCYLTYSGKYLISLYDNAGNIQKFNYGNPGQTDKFTFIFLKDVPFTVTYTDPETNQTQTSLPIKQAIYNGSVTLNIDKATRSDFYTTSGYPSLTIYRNGAKISVSPTDAAGKISYTLTQTGYYEYFFTATSNLSEVGKIREEKYQFTILNPNEYRYSYIYNQYSNYYIEKVVKNGTDITNRLVQLLDVETLLVDQKEYMVELPLSYLDEKTGAGTYMITVNSNEKYFKGSSTPTSWTYQVVVRVGAAPISVSVAEGKATSNAVKITFNKTNLYRELGECKVRILRYDDGNTKPTEVYSLSINETTTNSTSTTINRDQYGTFFVQVVAPSGNLLFSYRVTKTEPMNVASIIAIVAAVIVAVVVIVIVYRLRKKISVK